VQRRRCQYLYFCTSKASKLSFCSFSRACASASYAACSAAPQGSGVSICTFVLMRLRCQYLYLPLVKRVNAALGASSLPPRGFRAQP
jgi:hypothetical protein